MKVEEVRIDSISNHSKNPKQHPDKQLRLLEESIKRFGWTNPVILSADNVILAGHARVKAAISAGNDTVPCIRTKLTGAEADAYLIADNRLSDLAPYDRDVLAELLGELPDDLAELTGFDSSDIDALLKGEDISEIDKFIGGDAGEKEEVDAEPQIDRAEELNKIWKVKTGDLWQCGEHRIICGDCTDPAVVERVMRGEKADLVLTDPPYGTASDSKVQKRGDKICTFNIEWDGKYPYDWVKSSGVFILPGAAILSFTENRAITELWDSFLEQGIKPLHTFYWIKPTSPQPRQNFCSNVESAVFGRKEGGKVICWNGGGATPNYFESPRSAGHERVAHETQKPLKLIVHLLNLMSEPGMVALEPFLGSGTTMIACENTGRKCRGIEISPDYVAVCLQRYQDATGKEPVRVE